MNRRKEHTYEAIGCVLLSVGLLCYMRSLRKGKESREIILPTQYNVSVRS